MNPYKVLGIRPNASKDEIEVAYKNIIESNNLNANSDNPVEFLTEEKLSKVNEAFQIFHLLEMDNFSRKYQQYFEYIKTIY